MSYPIEVNGAAASTLHVTLPVFGVGTFRVVIIKAESVSAESGALRVVYNGGTLTGSLLATYNLSAGVEASGVFGYRGWASVLPAKSYHSAAGVRLSTVLTDLERETGERFENKPDTVLGTHWNRPAGIASRALNAAAIGWRVLPSGVTTLAPASGPLVRGKFEVTDLDEARGVYTIGCDDPSEFVPGVLFKSPMMATPQRAGTVEHSLGEVTRVTVHAVRP